MTNHAAGLDELAELARTCLAAGGTLDQAAEAVLTRTQSPITAIKALRAAAPGLSLADAKPIVSRNLPQATIEAAERLWAELVQAVRNEMNCSD